MGKMKDLYNYWLEHVITDDEINGMSPEQVTEDFRRWVDDMEELSDRADEEYFEDAIARGETLEPDPGILH